MKKLLSYLGLIATLLAIPNLSKADDLFKYYLIGNINNWSKSGCMTDNYFFGQSSSPKDAVTWSKDFSGVDLLRNVSGTTAYFKIWVKQIYNGNENDGNAQYYLTCTGNSNTKVNIDGNAVYIDAFNARPDDVSLYIEGVQASHTYRITFVSGTGNENDNSRKKGTIKVDDVTPVTTSSVYLLGTINSWGNNGNNGTDYPLSLDNGEYKLNLTKAQVQSALHDDDFYFRFTENMSDNSSHGVVPDASVVKTPITVNAAYTNAYTTSGSSDSKKDNYWSFTPTGADNYTIYFKNNNGTRQVKVVDVLEPLYLHSNLTSQWDGSNNTPLTYNSSTGYYEMTLTESQINGAYANDGEVRFRIGDGTSSWQPSSTYAFSKRGTEVHDLTSTGTSNYLSIPKNIKSAKIQAKKVTENNTTKIVVYVSLNYFYYYWVSPEITNGEMWPSFRMEPSRNRYWSGSAVIGDGKISMKYFTFTIKDDDLVTWKTKKKIDDNTQIKWWIVRDDGEVFYRPKDDLAVGYIPHDNNPYDNDHPITGSLDDYVRFINYWNGSSYDGETAYKNVSTGDNDGSWSFSKGSAKAHTFNLNAEKGHVLYNYTTPGATIDPNGYDLAGNWSTGVEVSISLNANDTKPMTKYWYKGKNSYESLDAYQTAVGDISSNPADSIVYKVNVDRPSGGWGGLYLVVFPTSQSRNWDNHPAVLRPLITMGNNLDGRALHGALTTSNSEQSLNPEPESYYTGYTFSFNATTRTYRLEFHTPDATLSPGTEDGELKFPVSHNEDITVNLSEDDGIHAEATQFALGFGDNANFVLDETTKYSDETFNLTYNPTSNQVTYTVGNTSDNNVTTGNVSGNTIYVKVRGFDAGNNYGDIHTYQYTFLSSIGFSPQGGLFINSAKLNITGGTEPYRYEIHSYGTKVENGELVIDKTQATLLSSGTFSGIGSSYHDSDNNYRISTPGFLKIIDANDNWVEYAEVGGGFDFTYSTSENYIRNTGAAIASITTEITTDDDNAAVDAGAYPNGADYWLAAPGDLSHKLDATWGGQSFIEETSIPNWDGTTTIYPKHITKDKSLTQTITGLDNSKTYTVQAIVRGLGQNYETVTLTLGGAETKAVTVNLRNGSGGSENSADLSRQGTEISKNGRVEYLEPVAYASAQNVAAGWNKVEASVAPTSAGALTISIAGSGEWFDLSTVTLLEDANTDHGFRTTASTSATDVSLFDYRDRTSQKNNAFSFFDRGKNRNALIYADKRTVIAMDNSLLSDAAAYKNVDRKHPFNVVATNGASDTQGVCEVLYLTDMGYGDNAEDDAANPVDYTQPSSTSDPNYAKYGKSGYSFKANIPFIANNVVLDRPFGNETKPQTTIMLPFSLTQDELKNFFGSTVELWKFDTHDKTNNVLTFTQDEDDLDANTPYIMLNATGTIDSRVTGKALSASKTVVANNADLLYAQGNTTDGEYTGSYKYQRLQSGDEKTYYVYGASSGKFATTSKNGTHMKPFRCYFTITTAQAAGAPSLSVSFDNVLTGISSVESVNLSDAKVYNVNGMLVRENGDLSNLPKGIYIVNGKKYVVK